MLEFKISFLIQRLLSFEFLLYLIFWYNRVFTVVKKFFDKIIRQLKSHKWFSTQVLHFYGHKLHCSA